MTPSTTQPAVTLISHRPAKFAVGQRVFLPRPTLIDHETEGEIIEINKVFKEVDQHGNFERNGLAHTDSDIPSIQLPYSFDGHCLTVSYPEQVYSNFTQRAYTQKSIFFGYAYVIRTSKMNTVFSEAGLMPMGTSKKARQAVAAARGRYPKTISWCKCAKTDTPDAYYVPDGVPGALAEHHHWCCSKCHQVTQLG
jgi:hypothetical protein